MKVKDIASIPGLKAIYPRVFEDIRGYFFESWNHDNFSSQVHGEVFVQDNESYSKKGTLRGMHLQLNNPQGKLVRVSEGRVFDAVVDCRKGSKTFGESFGIELSSANKIQLWIPPGFAHGFLVLSDFATFNYKCTQYYDSQSEKTILWNDPSVNIKWPLDLIEEKYMSEKDLSGISFKAFTDL